MLRAGTGVESAEAGAPAAGGKTKSGAGAGGACGVGEARRGRGGSHRKEQQGAPARKAIA
eukprot:1749464-Pyramimonas_sp.AAC.1